MQLLILLLSTLTSFSATAAEEAEVPFSVSNTATAPHKIYGVNLGSW